MHRVFAWIIPVATALAFTLPARAQSAWDVLKSFRKLQADTEAGVNYDEYARGLADVNAQLRSFADTSPGKPPAGIEKLRAAFALYLKARTVWDEQRLQVYRYNNGELSLRDYYDEKAARTHDISSLWEQAGQEIDRAAVLLQVKQPHKGK